jgi:ADP-ribosylglycohydrolase
MRIIPVALRFASESTKQLLDRVHRVSAITHRHLRSQMACGLYALVVRELLTGSVPNEALTNGIKAFHSFYESDLNWAVELDHFELLLSGRLGDCHEAEIHSSGYVIDTLTASLWCLLTTTSYEECVLRAVNLGGDTDTTGCVAGGLAGVLYGYDAIPVRWRETLARADELKDLFNRFPELVPTAK